MVYNKYLKKTEGPVLLSSRLAQPISLRYAENELLLYIKNTADEKSTIEKLVVDFNFETQFTNKQLISYIFKHNKLDFSVDIPRISKEPKEENLQIIEIAVDAGTSKSFLEATLTELIQNSMDAIRLTDARNQSIHITTGIVEGKSDCCFCTIHDFVGMSLSNVQAISIPFYSNKTASEIATGEMGTGFFNVYRDSDIVIIDTVKNGHRILIQDRPVRKNGRIQDIEKRVTEHRVNAEDGTSITFVVTQENSQDVLAFLSVVNYTVTNIFAYMSFRDVILNNISVKRTKRLIYRLDELECYVTDIGVKSYIFTKGVPFSPLFEYFKDSIGQLGISQEQLDFLDNNVIINIKHGFYTPVQSRTKLNIPPENLLKLRTFLKKSIFYALVEYLYMACEEYALSLEYNKKASEVMNLYQNLWQERSKIEQEYKRSKTQELAEEMDRMMVDIERAREKLTQMRHMYVSDIESKFFIIQTMPLLHLFSDSRASQVRPEYFKPNDFVISKLTDVIFYTPTGIIVPGSSKSNMPGSGGSRMIDHITYIYAKVADIVHNNYQNFPIWEKGYRDYVTDILKNIKDIEDRIFADKFFTIIEVWLSTKREPIPEKKEVIPKKNEEVKVTAVEKELDDQSANIFRAFVNTFLTLAQEHKIDGYPREIPVVIKNLSPSVLGSFNGTDININKWYIDKGHLTGFIENIPNFIRNRELLRDDPFYRAYFGVSFPASTVIHELEHARRNSRHDQRGVHDDIEIAIFGRERKRYSYDEIATDILLYLIDKGLIERFLSSIK